MNKDYGYGKLDHYKAKHVVYKLSLYKPQSGDE